MQPQLSAPQDGLVVAHGHGLKISVNRGHLIVHDGVCDERRTRRYHRATSKLRRLVVVGHSGFVTLEALRWLRDARAALIHIDGDGQLLTATASAGPDLAGLRRAQALAASTPVGVELARWILAEKTSGQRALMQRLPATNAQRAAVDLAHHSVTAAGSLEELLAAEAQCAAAYWDAWAKVPVDYGRAAHQTPEHWRTFHQRHSPLSRSPRLAINPAGAILNYLYALLEAETEFACRAQGLDPGVGVFHADRRDRASLALDLMEATRPTVDAYLLTLLNNRTLNVRDFAETRRGDCRILPSMAARLSQTASTWAAQVDPVVQRARKLLESGSNPSPDCGYAPSVRPQRRAVRTARLPDSCTDCGQAVTSRRYRYCEKCRAERFRASSPAGRRTAAAVLAQLRDEGRDPAHGGEAGRRRGEKNAAHQTAVRSWAGERPDPSVFAEQILPGLRTLRIRQLAAATGLSVHYCSLIRLGKRVPHPRHWEALRTVAASERARSEVS